MSVDVYATVCMDWLYSFWISKMDDFENYWFYVVIVALVEVWFEVSLFWFGGTTGFGCKSLFVMLLLLKFWFVWLMFVRLFVELFAFVLFAAGFVAVLLVVWLVVVLVLIVVFVLFWAGTVVEFVVVPFALTVWLAEHVKLTAFNTDQDWHSTHLLLFCMQVLQFASVHVSCKKQVLFKRK